MDVLGSDLTVDLHSYAIVGAAAMLGGATRMTISITLLVMETTGALQMLVPLMVTIYVAKVVADNFSKGIYDAHIALQSIPFLEEYNDGNKKVFGVYETLNVTDVMITKTK